MINIDKIRNEIAQNGGDSIFNSVSQTLITYDGEIRMYKCTLAAGTWFTDGKYEAIK